MNTKKSETNKCEREIILRLHEDGKSYNEIIEIVNRSKSTIHYIIKKSKNEGSLANKARSGRPKKLTGREKKVIIREIKKNLTTSAPQLAISAETCRRILRSENFHGRAARKMPFINKISRAKRLAFAKEYVNKSNTFWQKLFSRMNPSLIFLGVTEQEKFRESPTKN
ncbi:hypothetical protein ANTPLA_LOCUS4874 [Anthophora plagiata]